MKKRKDWWIRAIFLLFVIVALCSMCSGCNTIHGFGEDIKTVSKPYITTER